MTLLASPTTSSTRTTSTARAANPLAAYPATARASGSARASKDPDISFPSIVNLTSPANSVIGYPLNRNNNNNTSLINYSPDSSILVPTTVTSLSKLQIFSEYTASKKSLRFASTVDQLNPASTFINNSDSTTEYTTTTNKSRKHHKGQHKYHFQFPNRPPSPRLIDALFYSDTGEELRKYTNQESTANSRGIAATTIKAIKTDNSKPSIMPPLPNTQTHRAPIKHRLFGLGQNRDIYHTNCGSVLQWNHRHDSANKELNANPRKTIRQIGYIRHVDELWLNRRSGMPWRKLSDTFTIIMVVKGSIKLLLRGVSFTANSNSGSRDSHQQQRGQRQKLLKYSLDTNEILCLPPYTAGTHQFSTDGMHSSSHFITIDIDASSSCSPASPLSPPATTAVANDSENILNYLIGSTSNSDIPQRLPINDRVICYKLIDEIKRPCQLAPIMIPIWAPMPPIYSVNSKYANQVQSALEYNNYAGSRGGFSSSSWDDGNIATTPAPPGSGSRQNKGSSSSNPLGYHQIGLDCYAFIIHIEPKQGYNYYGQKPHITDQFSSLSFSSAENQKSINYHRNVNKNVQHAMMNSPPPSLPEPFANTTAANNNNNNNSPGGGNDNLCINGRLAQVRQMAEKNSHEYKPNCRGYDIADLTGKFPTSSSSPNQTSPPPQDNSNNYNNHNNIVPYYSYQYGHPKDHRHYQNNGDYYGGGGFATPLSPPNSPPPWLHQTKSNPSSSHSPNSPQPHQQQPSQKHRPNFTPTTTTCSSNNNNNNPIETQIPSSCERQIYMQVLFHHNQSTLTPKQPKGCLRINKDTKLLLLNGDSAEFRINGGALLSMENIGQDGLDILVCDSPRLSSSSSSKSKYSKGTTSTQRYSRNTISTAAAAAAAGGMVSNASAGTTSTTGRGKSTSIIIFDPSSSNPTTTTTSVAGVVTNDLTSGTQIPENCLYNNQQPLSPPHVQVVRRSSHSNKRTSDGTTTLTMVERTSSNSNRRSNGSSGGRPATEHGGGYHRHKTSQVEQISMPQPKIYTPDGLVYNIDYAHTISPPIPDNQVGERAEYFDNPSFKQYHHHHNNNNPTTVVATTTGHQKNYNSNNRQHHGHRH
ncbi:hypothetical protein H4219_006167 [Mycoemilia scoparia]|uniref:Uncharacterized protein n=1 Tax=Mycoemilia scoparia TaxID=417184 RepID=A0A9W7ZU65_9FUNG|nr:hypothetical protein H4219_006167 [Mycoemilia scoparia]